MNLLAAKYLYSYLWLKPRTKIRSIVAEVKIFFIQWRNGDLNTPTLGEKSQKEIAEVILPKEAFTDGTFGRHIRLSNALYFIWGVLYQEKTLEELNSPSVFVFVQTFRTDPITFHPDALDKLFAPEITLEIVEDFVATLDGFPTGTVERKLKFSGDVQKLAQWELFKQHGYFGTVQL